jgi:hypothetical protein
MKDKTITLRQASEILGIPEKEIINLAAGDNIPHTKMEGGFLRFHREDILGVKGEIAKKYNLSSEASGKKEKIKNFLFFNDFYIIGWAVIIILFFIIFNEKK